LKELPVLRKYAQVFGWAREKRSIEQTFAFTRRSTGESMIRKFQLLTLCLLSLLVLLATTSQAQITPSKDAYTNSADPTTNFGTNVLLDVDGASQITYIQFNLASVPSGTGVRQATLKLFVNAVTTAGSFNVDYVNGTWSEGSITSSLAPALGSTIVSNVSITTGDRNQYVLINVTPAVQAWLDGSQANDGLALVANSTFNASFDSKENTTTSHAPELDIVFDNAGTITGITTATGSGLTGGGTNGTLNLSLLNTCANGQVLEWSGTAWACATAAGTGTITGVTAGTDLTGGGTSGKVQLNLDTTKVPQLNTANTFTANQGVMGNVTVSGTVGIGTTTASQALDLGTNNNMVIRTDPGNDTTQADGGYALVGRGAGGVPNTWWTQTAPVGGGFGVPANSYSIWQYPPNSVPGCCLNRLTILPAKASTDTGGTVTIDQNGNVSQSLAAGGMVKAMVFVCPDCGIINCFNSTLTGSAATTPPCGFGFVPDLGDGDTEINFGFKVDNRFLLATAAGGSIIRACTDTTAVPAQQFVGLLGCTNVSSTDVYVQTLDPFNNFAPEDDYYWLVVY
jgi:predicted RNA-binding Zn-ribbon protein involved in translation (DUF1610 family)